LTKKKDTSATKANKEASASATVFAHSGITKSMVGTAFIACLMNVDFARLPPLSLLMARGFLPESTLGKERDKIRKATHETTRSKVARYIRNVMLAYQHFKNICPYYFKDDHYLYLFAYMQFDLHWPIVTIINFYTNAATTDFILITIDEKFGNMVVYVSLRKQQKEYQGFITILQT
jgi:hypothetical protein